jgi:hypothetical protein
MFKNIIMAVVVFGLLVCGNMAFGQDHSHKKAMKAAGPSISLDFRYDLYRPHPYPHSYYYRPPYNPYYRPPCNPYYRPYNPYYNPYHNYYFYYRYDLHR